MRAACIKVEAYMFKLTRTSRCAPWAFGILTFGSAEPAEAIALHRNAVQSTRKTVGPGLVHGCVCYAWNMLGLRVLSCIAIY